MDLVGFNDFLLLDLRGFPEGPKSLSFIVLTNRDLLEVLMKDEESNDSLWGIVAMFVSFFVKSWMALSWASIFCSRDWFDWVIFSYMFSLRVLWRSWWA